MKAIRLVSFTLSLSTLLGLLIGTVSELVKFMDAGDGFNSVIENPDLITFCFYNLLSDLGFSFEFFGQYGPLAIVALLLVIVINSIT